MAEHTIASKAIQWRLLRLLLPGRYRRSYGDELLRTHVEVSGTRSRGMSFWLRVAGDVFLTSAQVRGDGVRGRGTTAPDRHRIGLFGKGARFTRDAVRDIARAPGFAAAVAITLGLGIGANVTMYTVLDRMLFSPPEQVRDADQVRRIYVHGKSPFSSDVAYLASLAYPDYRQFQKAESFESVAGYTPRFLTVGTGEDTERLKGELATASYFTVLGVRPALGRFYTEADDQAGAAAPAAVLSYGYWQRRFGGSPNAIGSSMQIGAGKYTVIGIAPRGFTGADIAPVDVWVPLHVAGGLEQGTYWMDAHDWYWFSGIARLKPGVTADRAAAETTGLFRAGRADRQNFDKASAVVLTSLVAGRGPEPSREALVTKALGAVALLVLLIACANAGNLFLARGVQRRRTYAVQTALGVSRGELIAQLFFESLLIALSAGVLAFGMARLVGPAVFRVLLPDAAPPTAAGLRVGAVTFAFALFTALTAGLLTAIRSSRIAPIEVLRAGRSGGRSSVLRRGLVALQAAFAVVLLVGAGLFLRSLREATRLDLGLDPSTISVTFEKNDGQMFGDEMSQLAYPAVERLRNHPGVESAAVVSIPPYFGYWGKDVDVPGPDSIPSGPDGPYFFGAGGDYFRTLGMRMIAGRALTDADDNGRARVAVVNETMAKQVWGAAPAVGQCLIVVPREGEDGTTPAPLCSTVVGVVNDYLPAVDAVKVNPIFYLPPHHPDVGMVAGQSVLVRLRPGSGLTMAELQKIARSAAPGIRYVKTATIHEMMASQLRAWQLGATLLTAFGLLALIVAAAGMYSLLAFDVAQRRFEFGVRSALGASAPRLVRGLLWDIGRIIAVGAVAGILISLALGRTARAMLFQVQPTDQAVYALALLLLMAIGLAAAALPAWRAVRVSPRTALTQES